MTNVGKLFGVTAESKTIWAINEHDRPAVVIEILKGLAGGFKDAVQRDNAGDAQDIAIQALSTIAGMFPDARDGVQAMLCSLMGALIGAKSGRSDHFLLRSTRPIVGTKKGFGHAMVGAFAISAVGVLTARRLMSGNNARAEIAKMLSDAGFSLKTDEHGQPLPITGSAIRNWSEKSEDFPLQNLIAVEMNKIHSANLEQIGASSKNETIEYFKFWAREIVCQSHVW